MANVRVEPDAARQRQHVIGTFGVVIAVSVAVILGVHPWGSTDLYDDGAEFVDHVGPFWLVIHFVGTVLFFGMPTLIGAWADTLRTPAGQVFGKLAASTSVGSVALGVLHLVGTDTTSFLTSEDTLASGQEGAPSPTDRAHE
jgi:hypothetical protein